MSHSNLIFVLNTNKVQSVGQFQLQQQIPHIQEKYHYQLWISQKHSFQTNQSKYQNRKRLRYTNDEHYVSMEADGHPQEHCQESVSEWGNSKGKQTKNEC